MNDEMLEFAAEHDVVLWDGCDAALIGIGERCGQPPLAVYDYGKLISVFIDQGMTYEESIEWISHNIAGAWIGDQTPVLVYRP